jgi:hypothetical protein
MKTLRLPQAQPRPDCLDVPATLPRLEPHRMPALPVACPAPREGTAQRYRMPLWRLFDMPGGD